MDVIGYNSITGVGAEIEHKCIAASYPRGLSAETLGLLGQVDALLKADPLPPRWALLRVLSLLEEHYTNSENATALRKLWVSYLRKRKTYFVLPLLNAFPRKKC